MEKFSQFRDKGSGVSPFIPTRTPVNALSNIVRSFVFLLRLVPFVVYTATYFLFLHNLPLPVAVRKLLLWGMITIPGIWWVDLQIDGVKRGHLSQQPMSRVPQPGSVITASFTSPVDALYLAAIFDPIFTISYPQSRKVSRVSLFGAMAHALSPAQLLSSPPSTAPGTGMTDLRTLVSDNPGRVVVVFPECATTNGKGVLPFSPSLLTVPAAVKIFPISIRYTPADITTPIPGAWTTFFWKLLSKPTHCIRVRIAEGMENTAVRDNKSAADDFRADERPSGQSHNGDDLLDEERLLLDRIADTLARLGRNARVGLTVRDKASFLNAWQRSKKR